MIDWSRLSTAFDAALVWPWLLSLGRVLGVLLLAWILVRVARRSIEALRLRQIGRASDPEEIRRIDTLMRVLRYLLTVVAGVVTALIVLGQIGIAVAPILGAAGVAGIAIGFGAQSLVKDFFTGFFLLLENQIRTGDVVNVGGKSGLVEEVNLRFVRLRDYDGNVHFVPNSAITTVTNMSRGFAFAVMDIGVAYREDIDRVIALIREVGHALEHEPAMDGVILEPLEIAGVERLADSAVVVRCRFKVLALQQWAVRRETLRRIKLAFDEHGIEIPFPQLMLHSAQPKA